MTRYLKESVNSILDFIREKLESNGFTIINYRADQVWRFAFLVGESDGNYIIGTVFIDHYEGTAMQEMVQLSKRIAFEYKLSPSQIGIINFQPSDRVTPQFKMKAERKGISVLPLKNHSLVTETYEVLVRFNRPTDNDLVDLFDRLNNQEAAVFVKSMLRQYVNFLKTVEPPQEVYEAMELDDDMQLPSEPTIPLDETMGKIMDNEDQESQ